MARQFNELRAFRTGLETYLSSKGWTDITYKEGFGFDEAITNPLLAVTELPLRQREFQMARDRAKEKLLLRVFQIDAYMESEHRAKAVADDASDFIDEEVIQLTDGYMISDTETIRVEIVPPNMTNPKVIRWRAIIRGTYEVAYL